jgi:iron complex transport system ATP-binding protein
MSELDSTRGSLLDISDLEVQRGSRRILSGLNLSVSSGEILFIVGPNGSGKSTLIETCLGLLSFQSGHLTYEGRSVPSISWEERPSWFGLVGREERDDLGLTVSDVLALGRSARTARRNDSRGETSPLSDESIYTGWLPRDFGARPIGVLSDGERQLVHITRGFLQNPQVLFWDEATAHLDLAHREAAFRNAKHFVARGHSMVVVAHELELALRFADRVIVLSDGQIQAMGPPRAALTRELLRGVFGVSAEVAVDHDGLIWR